MSDWTPIAEMYPPWGIYAEFVLLSGMTRSGCVAALGEQPPARRIETVFLAEDDLGRRVYFAADVIRWREREAPDAIA